MSNTGNAVAHGMGCPMVATWPPCSGTDEVRRQDAVACCRTGARRQAPFSVSGATILGKEESQCWGDRIGEERGRVTGRRALQTGDPRYLKLEISFETQATLYGVPTAA